MNAKDRRRHAIAVAVVLSIVAIMWIRLLPHVPGLQDYEVKLPNGYLLARTAANNVSIAAPEDRYDLYVQPVPAEIVALGAKDEFVFGKVQRHPSVHYVTRYERRVRISGYFILNTKNDDVKIGLDKEEWLERLADLGIKEEPVLKAPSRDFTY